MSCATPMMFAGECGLARAHIADLESIVWRSLMDDGATGRGLVDDISWKMARIAILAIVHSLTSIVGG